mmetsp:Transcript_18538/g.53215  ORF Transcript_18538/g.53215 Transcript_18538/m.53215 type:complete len:342 (+) Transcript_18538:214-1239(+)
MSDTYGAARRVSDRLGTSWGARPVVRLVPSKVGRARRYSGGTRVALAEAEEEDAAAMTLPLMVADGFLESPPCSSSSPSSAAAALGLWPAVGIMTRLLGEAVVRWVMAGAANSLLLLLLELLLLAELPLLSFLVRLLDLAASSFELASAAAAPSGSGLAALRFLPVTAAAAADARARPLDLDRVVLLAVAAAAAVAVAVVPLDADGRPLLAPPAAAAAALPSSAASSAVRLAAFRARLPKAPLPRRDFPWPPPAATAAEAALSSCAAAGSAASLPPPVDDLVFRRVSIAPSFWGAYLGSTSVPAIQTVAAARVWGRENGNVSLSETIPKNFSHQNQSDKGG